MVRFNRFDFQRRCCPWDPFRAAERVVPASFRSRRLPSAGTCTATNSRLVRFRSGLVLEIPDHHPVFTPAAPLADGTVINPATTSFVGGRAGATLRVGRAIVVDNRVEVVAALA